MSAQVIISPGGERLVVLPEHEYAALLEAADDAADIEAVRAFRRLLAAGEEEWLPADLVERILAGENPVRVWRRHRGLSGQELAEKAGISQPYLSEIETGKKEGSVSAMKQIAEALGVSLDDLVS